MLLASFKNTSFVSVWVLLPPCGLAAFSLVVVSGGYSLAVHAGFSLRWLLAAELCLQGAWLG